MCVLSIKEPIRKKSGNLSYAPSKKVCFCVPFDFYSDESFDKVVVLFNSWIYVCKFSVWVSAGVISLSLSFSTSSFSFYKNVHCVFVCLHGCCVYVCIYTFGVYTHTWTQHPCRHSNTQYTLQCSSYWKGILQVVLVYSHQLYLYIYILSSPDRKFRSIIFTNPSARAGYDTRSIF